MTVRHESTFLAGFPAVRANHNCIISNFKSRLHPTTFFVYYLKVSSHIEDIGEVGLISYMSLRIFFLSRALHSWFYSTTKTIPLLVECGIGKLIFPLSCTLEDLSTLPFLCHLYQPFALLPCLLYIKLSIFRILRHD